jgi:hypothetical protein
MKKFVATSPSTPIRAAFRDVDRCPIHDFPKCRNGLLEDGVIKDEDVKLSNGGRRCDRLLNETAGLLASGPEVIRALKEGAAQLVSQRNRAPNRKEFLLEKAGAIFSLKVLSRTGFDRGRLRSLGSGCRQGRRRFGAT